MKRRGQIILNITTLITMQGVYYLSNFYPRHIFHGFSSFSVADFIFNLVFFTIYASFLIIAFSRNKTFFSAGAFRLRGIPQKSVLVIKFFVLLVLQLGCDFARVGLDRMSISWAYIGSDILTVIYWVLIYVVLVQNDAAIWKSKKRLLCVMAILGLTLCICFIWDVFQIKEYRALQQKYLDTSPYLARARANMDFFHSIKALIAESLIVCVLLVLHTLGIEKNSPKKLTENEWMEAESNRVQEKIKLFYRCNLVLVAIALLGIVKMAMAPQTVTTSVSGKGNRSFNYEANGPFNFTSKNQTVRQGMKEDSDSQIYYYSNQISLQKGDIEPVEFTFNGEEPKTVLGDCIFEMSDYCRQYNIYGSKVYLYGNYAICFYGSSSPRIVKITELNDLEENDTVITLCKQLLSDGNIFIFEYGAEYLLKYEKGFIEPYVERYSNGIFNENEKQWMEESFYRSEYIVEIAKQFSCN